MRAERLEVHHGAQPFQRIARGRKPAQTLLRVEETTLTRHPATPPLPTSANQHPAPSARGFSRRPVGADRRSKGGSRGYDAGKKIAGRKRHILTDTDGRLLEVQVHAGSVQDRDGAKPLLRASRGLWAFVETVFADGGYAGKLVEWAKQKANLALSIVKRPRAVSRFEPLLRRWVIERSFGWLIKNRRLVRDFEQRTDVAETLIRIAATATML
ncbi:MAG: transposase, partial [Planctomycetes bacterium]|nr:transposase [Planctomycetota bacterium]